ncbi:MAG: peptidylprolyl isomerase [Candidatus Limnocylindrales bacterium]
MTLRARTRRPNRIQTRIRRVFEGEERQQAAVTIMFLVAIAAIVLILVGVIGLSWYNDNLRPLARVGSVEVGPQQLRDHVGLRQWRIQTEMNRLTQANIDQQIDAPTLQQKMTALQTEQEGLTSTALDDLVDLIYQSQLAATEGITVTDADVDAALAKEFNGVEKRHVLAIFVKPATTDGDPTAELSNSDRIAALAKAQAAKGALDAGQAWADVAREFSTDASAANGGDYGVVTEVSVIDEGWGDRLFELPLNGTTEIVRGDDGTYRIGRVTEIVDAPEEPGLREQLREDVSDKSVREMVRQEVAVDKLSDKITNAALAETPEQARIALIYVEGLGTGDPEEAEGEIDYSEIAFAPNNDLLVAPDLPPNDTAWEAARVQAQTAYDDLIALTAGEIQTEKFREIASTDNDSPSSADEGAVGFVTRGIPPTEVGDALWNTPHQPNDLIGPIKTDAAYYILLFHERRDTADQRVAKVKEELAKADADFAALARQYSDGPEAEEGGEVGWVSRTQLSEDIVDKVFELAAGQVSEPLELGEGHYFIKVEEKVTRPLDPDQIPDIRATAFDNWYGTKRDEAEAAGTIVFEGDTGAVVDPGALDPGLDQP